jgi:hypothetical protein
MPFSDYRLHTLTADTAIDDILLRWHYARLLISHNITLLRAEKLPDSHFHARLHRYIGQIYATVDT